jgi:hypothetical protein
MGRVVRRRSGGETPMEWYEARYEDERGKEQTVRGLIFTKQFGSKKAAERAVERAESDVAKRKK